MNIERIRNDFPILNTANPPIYFDNACQTLRPQAVIDAMNRYYAEYPACAGRSNHALGRRVTTEIALARTTARKFLNARKDADVIFTRNTTEGINLVAKGLGLQSGDEVLISDKEHNSNLIPWQILTREKGIVVKRFRFGESQDFKSGLTRKTRLASFAHTSNLDGTSNPAKELIGLCHDNGTRVLLDAAQSAPHQAIDVKKLDADYVSLSGHKMLGPSGTGILTGKSEALNALQPLIVGGETVTNSTYESADWEPLPHRFEAGLQDYAGIIGLAEAMRYLDKIGMDQIAKHDAELNERITDGLQDAIKPLGPLNPKLRGGVYSFTIPGLDVHAISVMLDSAASIMIRSGMHCCHSWFNANKLPGSARASVYLYNTIEECDTFIANVRKIASTFRK